eukprot:scaffold13078_cov118-Isochrysis_galbana.AAC.4
MASCGPALAPPEDSSPCTPGTSAATASRRKAWSFPPASNPSRMARWMALATTRDLLWAWAWAHVCAVWRLSVSNFRPPFPDVPWPYVQLAATLQLGHELAACECSCATWVTQCRFWGPPKVTMPVSCGALCGP